MQSQSWKCLANKCSVYVPSVVASISKCKHPVSYYERTANVATSIGDFTSPMQRRTCLKWNEICFSARSLTQMYLFGNINNIICRFIVSRTTCRFYIAPIVAGVWQFGRREAFVIPYQTE